MYNSNTFERIVLFLVIVFIVTVSSFAQEYKDKYTIRKIVIEHVDSTIRFSILNNSVLKKTDEKKFYYWYRGKRIYKNQGGYSGYLLHGLYSVYSKSGSLIESGKFINGLKAGKWYQWHNNGIQKNNVLWKNGLMEGNVSRFNDKGILMSFEHYKAGVKHGKQFFYSDEGLLLTMNNYSRGFKEGKQIKYSDFGKPKVIRYKKGKRVVKSVKKKKNNQKKKERIKKPEKHNKKSNVRKSDVKKDKQKKIQEINKKNQGKKNKWYHIKLFSRSKKS